MANAKNVTFKAIADDFIRHKCEGPKPWRDSTRDEAEWIINKLLAPLHDLRPADITPKHIFDIVDPLRVETWSMADENMHCDPRPSAR